MTTSEKDRVGSEVVIWRRQQQEDENAVHIYIPNASYLKLLYYTITIIIITTI